MGHMFDTCVPCRHGSAGWSPTLDDMRGGRRGRLSVLPAIATGGLLSGGLVGCGGGEQRLDTTSVERAIEASIVRQRGVRTTVRCPPGVPRTQGRAFTCIAKLDVGSYPVAVTIKDPAGHVRYSNAAPLVALDTRRVQRAIAASIASQRHVRATVRCPMTVLQQAGLRFTCTATVAGRSYPFEVTETDGAGHVRYVGR